ncbi:hypothetical protein AeMF1_019176 [Aphanomyces euteiches]|nr:hypothetical protein AeMF1_019176 [Aphanomyces euteiches]KAH9187353.1 hypothetical protein AeNC1_010668 [Aphanomyces euteiches]
MTRLMQVTQTYADRRRQAAREGMAKLRAKRKRLVKVLMVEIENLEMALGYLQAHPEDQRKKINPFAYVRSVLKRRSDALNVQLIDRERWINWLCGWNIPSTRPYFMDVTLREDDQSRQSGCVYVTHRTYNMSQRAYPYKPFGNQVDDLIDVEMHVREDDHGVCIQAFECHLQFTIFANYENVAKTWHFDFTESTPAFAVKAIEEMDDGILCVIHEHNEMKLKRIAVSGVFRGQDGQDRITITHAGIAVDDRFPFAPGEVRSNGFQWVVFEHVTDLITLVRWSLLNFRPVNADGPLPLRDIARSLHCPVSKNDSDELIVERIRRASNVGLEKLRDQFCQ